MNSIGYSRMEKGDYLDRIIINRPKNLIIFQIFYVLFILLFRDTINLPHLVLYVTDILTILSLVFSLGLLQKRIRKAGAQNQAFIVLLIVFCMIIGAMSNGVSPILFIWGLRNNLRFFAFFLACITLLDKQDLSFIIKIFKFAFVINLIVSLVQYFIFNIKGDYLGGIFGVTKGCNIYTNVLICTIITIVFNEYLNGKSKAYKLIFYSFFALLIAALAELKVFYVEFIICIIFSLLFKKFSIKKLILSIVSVLAIIFGLYFLTTIFPNAASTLLELSEFNGYLTGNGYTNTGDLNRFTALQSIYQMFFKDNFFDSLFGFGLGSCDTSSFFSSSFFDKYEYLHYRWFSHSWIYLEQGLIGLILFVLFFISIMIFCLKFKKNEIDSDYSSIGIVFVVLVLIGIIYNSSLQVECAYLIAPICAMPFIAKKCNGGKIDNFKKSGSFQDK